MGGKPNPTNDNPQLDPAPSISTSQSAPRRSEANDTFATHVGTSPHFASRADRVQFMDEENTGETYWR
jgi:hypothetical protein